MRPKIAKMLDNTWAPVFYKEVFCKINEELFAPLYCLDNGRPNRPVNILLSLEIIKHIFDYTDKEILEQFYFNFQVLYALGWAEGKAEGRIEGKVEQTQEIICKYLTIRFGMDSSEVKNKVQEINLVIFEHLLTELFDANSREEARTILWAAME